mgnify:CR=1 FL=1
MKPRLLVLGFVLGLLGDSCADEAAITAAREIDALLTDHWQRQGVTPNPPADDATFVRRLHLDLVGRIPTLEETRAFLDDRSPDKHSRLIDRLLASPGFDAHFFHFWADLLRVQSRANGGQGEMTSKPYVEHIKRRIRENLPYDAFVRELLTAQGKVWDNPAIGYSMRDLGMPLDNMANTVRVFLGTRIECAQCHNHPFDTWTQMQFHQMAAYTYPLETNFTGVAEKGELAALKRQAERAPGRTAAVRHLGSVFENLGDFVRYSKVQALPTRVLKLPHDYAYSDAAPRAVVPASPLFGSTTDASLQAFADWLTSPENPRFTKVIANRLWKKVFGAGLFEPVDEIFDSTAPVNAPLMSHLERLMIACSYDLRAYLRALYHTRAYQNEATSAELQPGETYAFPGPLLRRLSAEQIYDSFVTLIQPTPDLPRRQGIDAEMAAKLAYKGKLSDALDLMSPQEIFTGALRAAEVYETVSARATPLRQAYAAALKAKDKAKMEQLNLEIRSTEFVARTGIHEHVVVPAVARLYKRKTGQPAPPPPPVAPPTPDNLRKAGQNRSYLEVPGYDFGRSIPDEEQAAAEARDAVFRAEVARYGVADPERHLRARRAQARDWPRAVDLESPAPRGHFLREFGQSDRELIDNANMDASVPQALVLMNSSLLAAVMEPHTQLSLNLAGAKQPEDVLAVVYLTVLSRPPSAREKRVWQQSGLTQAEDLVHALINTQQFLFIP